MSQSKSLIEWIKEWEKGWTGKVKSIVGSDVIIFNKRGMVFETRQMPGIALVCNYELIPEPVDFIAAVKAYEEGKNIRCERDTGKNSKYITVYSKKHCNNMCDTELGRAINADEILHGTWYIED